MVSIYLGGNPLTEVAKNVCQQNGSIMGGGNVSSINVTPSSSIDQGTAAGLGLILRQLGVDVSSLKLHFFCFPHRQLLRFREGIPTTQALAVFWETPTIIQGSLLC